VQNPVRAAAQPAIFSGRTSRHADNAGSSKIIRRPGTEDRQSCTRNAAAEENGMWIYTVSDQQFIVLAVGASVYWRNS
jgi:hypothetical protein